MANLERILTIPLGERSPLVIQDVQFIESLVDQCLSNELNGIKKSLLSPNYQFTIYTGWVAIGGFAGLTWVITTIVLALSHGAITFGRYLSWDVPILASLFLGALVAGDQLGMPLKRKNRALPALMLTFLMPILFLSLGMLAGRALSIHEVFTTLGQTYRLWTPILIVLALVGTGGTAWMVSFLGSQYILLVLSATGLADIIGPLPRYTVMTERVIRAALPALETWPRARVQQARESIRSVGSDHGTQSQVVTPLIGFFGITGLAVLIPSDRVPVMVGLGTFLLVVACAITLIWVLFLTRGYRLLRVFGIADQLCIQRLATIDQEALLRTLLVPDTAELQPSNHDSIDHRS